MINAPILCFLSGILASLVQVRLPKKLNHFLTLYILFCIGLKGGKALNLSLISSLPILTCLILWGLLQPVIAYFLLKKFTRVDPTTGAAISASFGSVSVMTFVTALSFLDQHQIPYQSFIIPALTILEIPAIISGILLAKKLTNLSQIFRESLLNIAILAIIAGLICGSLFSLTPLFFTPALCLFLFSMGLQVGHHRHQFRSFSLSLNLFALYMPLIGGFVGLLLSYLLQLDVGTGTLIAVLSASASYIAVPAAMRIALPQAKEAIYLPLSIGIVFPFNVLIGIPIYYHLARKFLI